MMSAIAGNAGIEIGHGGMSLGLKCGEIRGQNVEYEQGFSTAHVPSFYSCAWHLLLNGKTCCGGAVISASALEVVHRRHHWDLPFRLLYTHTSSSTLLCCAKTLSASLGEASV